MENFVVSAPKAGEVVKTVTATPVKIDLERGVYKTQYQKDGTASVQLRQEVTQQTSYPSARATNSLNGSIASDAEFGFAKKDYSSTEKRVGWINVPAAWTVEQAIASLAKFPNASLYKVLDNRPILSDSQEYAIANGVGEKTLNDYANDQAVRYSDTHTDVTKRGKLILDPAGKIQYRAIFFDQNGCEDQDLRTANPEYGYVSPELEAEISGVPMNASSIKEQGLS